MHRLRLHVQQPGSSSKQSGKAVVALAKGSDVTASPAWHRVLIQTVLPFCTVPKTTAGSDVRVGSIWQRGFLIRHAREHFGSRRRGRDPEENPVTVDVTARRSMDRGVH